MGFHGNLNKSPSRVASSFYNHVFKVFFTCRTPAQKVSSGETGFQGNGRHVVLTSRPGQNIFMTSGGSSSSRWQPTFLFQHLTFLTFLFRSETQTETVTTPTDGGRCVRSKRTPPSHLDSPVPGLLPLKTRVHLAGVLGLGGPLVLRRRLTCLEARARVQGFHALPEAAPCRTPAERQPARPQVFIRKQAQNVCVG